MNEPIGEYEAILRLSWWPKGLLEETITAYAQRHGLKRMQALVAATPPYHPYRCLVLRVDWRAAGVDDADLLTPESGAMTGEAFAALLAGESMADWRSSDGLALNVEKLGS